ncbi:MAG TPA: hypothetical protein VJ846_00480 [Sphingomicrobium sp.]|nr:hypothetical protein [Sphingomicrobium sp.]
MNRHDVIALAGGARFAPILHAASAQAQKSKRPYVCHGGWCWQLVAVRLEIQVLGDKHGNVMTPSTSTPT